MSRSDSENRSARKRAAREKERRISGSFWTLERDERLRRLEAEGLSAAKIGEKLGTTRGAVLGRLHRLSGAALTYPSYIRQEKEARARAAARMKERKRVESTVIPRMQQEITRGVGRDRAIARARKAGATLRCSHATSPILQMYRSHLRGRIFADLDNPKMQPSRGAQRPSL